MGWGHILKLELVGEGGSVWEDCDALDKLEAMIQCVCVCGGGAGHRETLNGGQWGEGSAWLCVVFLLRTGWEQWLGPGGTLQVVEPVGSRATLPAPPHSGTSPESMPDME